MAFVTIRPGEKVTGLAVTLCCGDAPAREDIDGRSREQHRGNHDTDPLALQAQQF